MSNIKKSSDNSDPKINFLIFFLDFLSFFWYYPKVGSDNSEPKIIFDFFLDFSSIFLVSKIQKSSDPKINYFDFFSRFFVIFLVLSKSWLIIRFRKF